MEGPTRYLDSERGVNPIKKEETEEGLTPQVMSIPAMSDIKTEDETEIQEEFCAMMERIKSEEMEIGDTKPAVLHKSCKSKRSEQSPEPIPQSSTDTPLLLRCRLCAIQNDDMVDIFGSKEGDILGMIECCLPIVVRETDTLPKRACRVCLDRLQLCYQFNQIVAEAESQLLAFDVPVLIKLDERDRNCQRSPGTVQCGATVHSEIEGTRLCGDTQNGKPLITVKKGLAIAETLKSSPGLTRSSVVKVATDNETQPRSLRNTDCKKDGRRSSSDDGPIDANPHRRVNGLPIANPVIEAPVDIRKRRHNCSECMKTYSTKSGLVEHSRLHTGKRLHTCQYCEKKFIWRSNKDVHERQVHSEERPFKCSLCEKSFKSSDSMMDHTLTHREHEVSAAYRCSVCDKAFKRKSAMERHMVVHTGEKQWQCDYCKKCYSRKSNLRSHLSCCKGRIDVSQQCHKCNLCPKSFKSKDGLSQHYRLHTGKDLHSCEYCEKNFTSRWKRDRHHLVHTDDRSYKCTTCDKSFKNYSNLKQHAVNHTDNRPRSQCDYCKNFFTVKKSLLRHLEICKKRYK